MAAMAPPKPQRPCPWCGGRDFIVVDSVFLEITDYGRRFSTVTCTTCGHTAFFTLDPPDRGFSHERVDTDDGGGPYR
jgi:hypothetical protein